MQAFISYAHSDQDRDAVARIANRLEQAGIRVWTDALIRAGDDFVRAIERAVLASDIFLVLLSPNYMTSEFCKEELAYLLTELRRDGRKEIISVMMKPTELSGVLASLVYIDGTQWGTDQLANIIAVESAKHAAYQDAGVPAS